MRANAGFDWLPITPSPRSAAAFSSGATLERITHRVVEPAIAAEPMESVLGSRTLHRGGTRDPTENLSRIGRVSVLLNSHRLLTPSLHRAANQQQKQHPGDRHNQRLLGRQAAQHAQGGSHPNGGGRRRPKITPAPMKPTPHRASTFSPTHGASSADLWRLRVGWGSRGQRAN